jgi:hypothetical protein
MQPTFNLFSKLTVKLKAIASLLGILVPKVGWNF